MDIRVVIFNVGIFAANFVMYLFNVSAEEFIDLDKLFYPAKIHHSHIEASNTVHHKTKENLPITSTEYIFNRNVTTQRHQDVESKSTTLSEGVHGIKYIYIANEFMTAKKQEELSVLKQVVDISNERIRLLCCIMTHPENHVEKAIHIKQTWGNRCTVLLFMSTESDHRLPTVALQVPDGRGSTWKKTMEAFKYIYDNYLFRADWYLKADDDTYVIIENLKHLLHQHNTKDPIYFGSKFNSNFTKSGYFSGGACVMSREAVTRLVSQGISTGLCKSDQVGAEDVDFTRCLDKLNVYPEDSRDEYQRGRFFPFMPHQHVQVDANLDFWYWKNIYYSIAKGRDCCSEYTISFHFLDNNLMYALEYFVYQLRPYGISYDYDVKYNTK